MNHLTESELAALDRYQPAWYSEAMEGRAEAGSAVSDVCGPINEDHREQVGRMEGLVVAVGLAVAVIGTLVFVHFAARWIA